METIIFALVIIILAGGAIWFYNRDAKNLDINQDGKIDGRDAIAAVVNAAKSAGKDARDARDAALVASAESAMKAAGVIENAARKTQTAVKKTAAKTAAKKSTTKSAAKPRTKK